MCSISSDLYVKISCDIAVFRSP